MADDMNKVPSQKELERELSDYLSRKYGDKIKGLSPRVVPRPGGGGGEKSDQSAVDRIRFDMKPQELLDYLDRYIVRQDEAKAILATKVCTHFNRIKFYTQRGDSGGSDHVGLIKNNIIMLGPTGVGKTYMVKLIADKLGVAFVKGDATKFSETGYVGGDVEDLVRDLVSAADDDIELAQYGIIYIDEIDKIASANNVWGLDVSRTGVQRALLKPMEETEVDLKVPHDPISQIQAIERYRKTGKKEKRTLNTKHILFIVSGAFNGLPEIIGRRLTKQSMGFGAPAKTKAADDECFKQVTARDLMDYGFESEFIGRLPVTAVLESLSADDLLQILKNPSNPILVSKRRDFLAYDIDIRFEDEALAMLASRAAEHKTGARSLVSVIEQVLIGFERTLPSTDVRQFLVTPEVVADPARELDRLLAGEADAELKARLEAVRQTEHESILGVVLSREAEFLGLASEPLTETRRNLVARAYYEHGADMGAAFFSVMDGVSQIEDFESEFVGRTGISIRFTEDSVDRALEVSAERGVAVSSLCQEFFEGFEYGFRLIRDKTGQSEFTIEPEAVDDPEGYLNTLIQIMYRHLYSDGSNSG